MLTDFGKELRKIRLNKGLLLKDMADALGITSSYLSAIEFGKRSVPDDLIARITARFGLNLADHQRLIKNALENEYTIRAKNPEQQELAAGLARRFDKLSPKELAKIKNILEGDE